MADFESISYRIRIGVTGHRKLDDPAAVQALVKKAIDAEVEKLFPEESRRNFERVRRAGTTAISFRVLSPLAEGADYLVARAVLSDPDARLDVVLPLTLEDYLEDFATEESRKEFEELLSRCRKPVLATVLLSWKERCPKSDEGWMFPSPITGRCYHASPQDYIRPAGRKLGLGDIGWHTFRHTYRSWLDSVGTSMGVQQKLMRHAQIATTMNVYGDAMMESKRAANSKVVQMVLRPALREAK